VALGNEIGGIDWETAVRQWNGEVWLPATIPLPSGSFGVELLGASCSSPSSCVAVGWYDTGPGTPRRPLIESYS
jgi:hypothetical protein